MTNSKIKIMYKGDFGTEQFSINYYLDGKQISPWKDIPYKNNDGTYNAIIEIPRWTREKMEMIKSHKYNSIKQDKKNKGLRFFKYGPIPFNYGFIPQTWEDPNKKDKRTGYVGDDDPIDIVEISNFQIGYGKKIRIKILGVLPMIDDGETDWKLIVVSDQNSNYDQINSLSDVSESKLNIIKKWFVYYKQHDGKIIKVQKYLGKDEAEKIIEETNENFNKQHNS